MSPYELVDANANTNSALYNDPVAVIHDDEHESHYSYNVEYDEDVFSQFSAVNNTKKKRRANFAEITSPGQHRVFRTVNRQRAPVEFFTTRYTPGSVIRNAVNGDKESGMYVGKHDERVFFKVKLATGELGQDPYGSHLYYDSPEQFERHFHGKVSQETKSRWWESSTQRKRELTKQLHEET